MVHLRLIKGGGAGGTRVNRVRISVLATTVRPLPVDVRVFEEDTHLVLTVDPVIEYQEEHPVRMLHNLEQSRTAEPGSIVLNGASWYAVVHDLDADTSCRPEWIELAYGKVLTEAQRLQIGRIGIPLLGSMHGSMPPEESLDMLVKRLQANQGTFPTHIALLAKPDHVLQVRSSLANLPG